MSSDEGMDAESGCSYLDTLPGIGNNAAPARPSQFPRPRIDIGIKREVVSAIIAADSETAAVKIVDRLWSMLRGDMQDRISSVLDAAWGTVEATDMNSRRDALKRALELVAPFEIAAQRHIPRPKKKGREGGDPRDPSDSTLRREGG